VGVHHPGELSGTVSHPPRKRTGPLPLSSDTKVDPRDDTNIDPLVDVSPMGCPERRP